MTFRSERSRTEQKSVNFRLGWIVLFHVLMCTRKLAKNSEVKICGIWLRYFFFRSNDANTNPHPQDSKNGINTAPLWGQSIWSTSKRCSCNSGWWTNTFWSTDWPVTVKNNHRAIIFGRNRTNSIAKENNKSNQESFVDRHPHLKNNTTFLSSRRAVASVYEELIMTYI